MEKNWHVDSSGSPFDFPIPPMRHISAGKHVSAEGLARKWAGYF